LSVLYTMGHHLPQPIQSIFSYPEVRSSFLHYVVALHLEHVHI